MCVCGVIVFGAYAPSFFVFLFFVLVFSCLFVFTQAFFVDVTAVCFFSSVVLFMPAVAVMVAVAVAIDLVLALMLALILA